MIIFLAILSIASGVALVVWRTGRWAMPHFDAGQAKRSHPEPEVDKARPELGRGEWTALDELQLIRLLRDSAP